MSVKAVEIETVAIVASLVQVAQDVVELTLVPADGAQLPPWEPGAHLDVVLGDGLVRQYSLCGSPSVRDSYTVAVLRAPDSRGGSEAVHRLAEGQRVTIRGPRNHFGLEDSARYVFIAGGIGITPIIPMIEQADASGADWILHYGGRTSGSMAYRERLAAHGDRVRCVPGDERGRIDLEAALDVETADTLVYCCGPESLLAAVEERCAGWPAGSLHLERFSPREHELDGEDSAFEVVLEQSGMTLTVEPGVTVFDTMRAAGVAVLGSCLEGVCGTCEQGVLAGEVDHRDSVLDDDERAANDCMMVCVSRARSPRLVLDA
ncbi:PDR/VanB family oxidoreductase [Aeromicrobium fastidiosum]|uniref:Oxidoreductase n=1 Tax=Aeromicrobium fastidiosum TaxID=52699 RepID=A0A641AR62_9ACTN|nr:PDR/VanB family oxidoreductase [Aeromicrobium fastidiosum]KAA1380596.1 oxidoreductase [Aeromicrobium fastidiosum]MBP2390195.1 ferredoxin-NADP reductase [Aeromicrobium fastidiosum]